MKKKEVLMMTMRMMNSFEADLNKKKIWVVYKWYFSSYVCHSRCSLQGLLVLLLSNVPFYKIKNTQMCQNYHKTIGMSLFYCTLLAYVCDFLTLWIITLETVYHYDVRGMLWCGGISLTWWGVSFVFFLCGQWWGMMKMSNAKWSFGVLDKWCKNISSRVIWSEWVTIS